MADIPPHRERLHKAIRLLVWEYFVEPVLQERSAETPTAENPSHSTPSIDMDFVVSVGLSKLLTEIESLMLDSQYRASKEGRDIGLEKASSDT
jgi:hypothetical protein